MEMDQNMATNLTLTLLVGWKVNCNNAEAVIQRVTLFDYSFSSKSMDCVGEK